MGPCLWTPTSSHWLFSVPPPFYYPYTYTTSLKNLFHYVTKTIHVSPSKEVAKRRIFAPYFLSVLRVWNEGLITERPQVDWKAVDQNIDLTDDTCGSVLLSTSTNHPTGVYCFLTAGEQTCRRVFPSPKFPIFHLKTPRLPNWHTQSPFPQRLWPRVLLIRRTILILEMPVSFFFIYILPPPF